MLATQLKYGCLGFAWIVVIKLIMNSALKLSKFLLFKSSWQVCYYKSTEWPLPVFDEIIDELLAVCIASGGGREKLEHFCELMKRLSGGRNLN